jgi:transcriptional regulator with XRE-family HTH domain
MDAAVRNLLLNRLKKDENFGQLRINELSDFLLVYVRQQLNSSDQEVRDFAQVQRWTALAYVRPSEAACELKLALEEVYQQDRSEQVRLASLIETFAEPLAEFQPLLVYAREMGKLTHANVESEIYQFQKATREERKVEVVGKNLPIPEQIFKVSLIEQSFKDSDKRLEEGLFTFTEAAHHWDLEKLHTDLASAKKECTAFKRPGLTPVEKLHLRGLLCGYSPQEIAERLAKNGNGVQTDLSRTLYRYVKVMMGNPLYTRTNWRNIVEWLEPKYKFKPNSTSSQVTEDANYSHLAHYQRSLALSDYGIKKVKITLKKRQLSQVKLAELCMVSFGTVKRFIKGNQISREIFEFVCRELNLEWKEIIAEPEDVVNELEQKEVEQKLKSVKYMLKLGPTVEQIAQILNLNVEQVIQAALESSSKEVIGQELDTGQSTN